MSIMAIGRFIHSPITTTIVSGPDVLQGKPYFNKGDHDVRCEVKTMLRISI